MKAYLPLLGLLTLFSSNCSAFETNIPLLTIKDVNWTSEEIAFIKAMKQQWQPIWLNFFDEKKEKLK